jgi:PhzF family phenazine biosynthesis protein
MIHIKHINAFTAKPFLGNPAAVVTQASGLTTGQMQLIAREMNLSETAYVLKPTRPRADLRLRWFTPTVEVSFCGHATIASFHALAEEKRFQMKKPGTYTFRLETRMGVLPVQVQKRSEGNAWIQVQVPQISFSCYGRQLSDVLAALQVEKKQLHSSLPVQIDARGVLYIPFERLQTLFDMKPNFDRLREVSQDNRLHGVCTFTPETLDRKSTFHSRFFAPTYGINEDPVTGSSNGPLGAYFSVMQLLKPINGTCKAIGEQGDVLGRKGRVSVEVDLAKDGLGAVRIGGEAVTVFEAPLRLK